MLQPGIFLFAFNFINLHEKVLTSIYIHAIILMSPGDGKKTTVRKRVKEMAFKSALENGKSAAYATYQGNVMGAIKLNKPASEMTKHAFLQVGRAVGENTYKTQKSKDNFYQGWCEAVEGLIRLGHTFYAPVSTWIVEIRDARGYENVESEETYEGTEEQAIEEGRSWLKEALTIGSYQKYVVVTRQEDGYTAYQGTFDMLPSGKEEEQASQEQESRFFTPEVGDVLVNLLPSGIYNLYRYIGTPERSYVGVWTTESVQTEESLPGYLEKEGLTLVKSFGRKQEGYYRKLPQEQGQEPLDTTEMECIGKQYVMHNGVQVQAVVYTPDYSTGLARITGPAIPVKFYKNVEGVSFPLQAGESVELKSIWIPVGSYEEQIERANRIPLTDFSGVHEFGDYIDKAIEALQVAGHEGEHISIEAIRSYLRRHHLYCTFDAVYNYVLNR